MPCGTGLHRIPPARPARARNVRPPDSPASLLHGLHGAAPTRPHRSLSSRSGGHSACQKGLPSYPKCRTVPIVATRPAARPASQTANAARTAIRQQLIKDHKLGKKVYRAFQKIDVELDFSSCEPIVKRVLAELQVHATLE